MVNVEEEYLKFQNDLATRAPGKVLLTRVAGSHSFGCETPDSDIDFFGIYQAPLRDVLKMNPPSDVIEHKNPDWQAFEVGKFCQLLLKGNPHVIECLFSDYFMDVEVELQSLFSSRKEFLNIKTLHQYLGYGRGQLQRLRAGTRIHSSGGKYNTKWAYHMMRMILDARQIAQGNIPEARKTGYARDYLMSIRDGDWSPEEIESEFTEHEKEVDALKPWPLPERADEDRLNKWLYNLRLSEVR